MYISYKDKTPLNLNMFYKIVLYDSGNQIRFYLNESNSNRYESWYIYNKKELKRVYNNIIKLKTTDVGDDIGSSAV